MRRNKVLIDQILHGYERGHKELASSIDLDSQSRSVMLVMSDSMAALEMKEGQSYLASYPLRSAAKHVLARTWSAGRGYRPGSVWTHSIILDYQALALISDLMALKDIFRHPEDGADHDFISPILFFSETTEKIDIEEDFRAMSALTQIYGESSHSNIVLPYSVGEKNELLALALWRQMWPGLRREFAFVTCPLDTPIGVDAACSLRFSKRESDFSNSENMVVKDGHLVLLQDLPYSGATSLRAFLGRYVIESKYPKKLAPTLAQLQSEIIEAPMGVRLEQVRKIAHDAHLSRLMRDAFMAELKAAQSAKNFIDIVCIFRDELIDIGAGSVLPSNICFSEEDLRNVISSTKNCVEGSVGHRVLIELVANAELESLVAIADYGNRLVIMQSRPELVLVKSFWPVSDEGRAKLLEELANKVEVDAEELFYVFGLDIGLRTTIAIQYISRELPLLGVLTLLGGGGKEVKRYLAAWVVGVPEFLSGISESGSALTLTVVDQLARAQIDSGRNIEHPATWSYLLFSSVFSEVSSTLSSAIVIVGFVVGMIGGEHSDLLLLRFYDPLQSIIKKYVSSQDENYLRARLPHYQGSRALDTLVTKNVLMAFSPSLFFDPQVFYVSQVSDYLTEIAREVEARYGLDALEKALNSGTLEGKVRGVVERYIKNAIDKKKSWTWW
ncbi:hypothetical protein [Pseudomonas sp. NPDC096950]|uniref:GAP1-N1 domain-containing protein n=1 Tax=Pseudomonas sp. NPDC096950 TaxID=3364485 RepID=UPI00383B30EA